MEHQKEKKRQSKSNSCLPLDLILEILLRLPEKSVGRFRSVSKLWLSITTDPYFINLFGNRSHRPSLLLCFKEDDKLFVSSILQHNQDMKDSYSCFKKFQECSLLPHTESVNGLICFQKSATPIIWNSSTQQYLYLPKPNIGWEYLTVLLGYDPIEGKHKLVCMPFQKSCDVCHVLTLGSVRESWRTVKNNHNHRSHYHTTGRCIKGVVYYLAYVHSTRVIMSFDVRLEKFDMIQLPSDHIHENVLTTYKGKLACVENFTTKDGRIICKDGKMVWEDSITLWILEDPEQHKWSSKDILAPFGQCDESLNAYFKDRGINVAGVFLYKSSSFPDLDYIIHFNRVMNTFEKIRVIRRRADGKARLYNKAKNRRMNQRFLHPSVIDPKAKEGEDANSFACYLSTSAGPVMGVLYISTTKLAYCSDNPVSYKKDGQTEWSYYKVVIPLHQLKLKAMNPSTSIVNPAEKCIQVISVDNHEFWFMGFLNYEGAVTSLQDSLHASRCFPVGVIQQT